MIKETVTLAFNPEKSSKEIKEVFANDLARTLWLGIRQGHLKDDLFEKHCLLYAKMIKRAKKDRRLTSEVLFIILSGMAGYPGEGIIGSKERDFAAELLPFVNGEKTIGYKVELKK